MRTVFGWSYVLWASEPLDSLLSLLAAVNTLPCRRTGGPLPRQLPEQNSSSLPSDLV